MSVVRDNPEFIGLSTGFQAALRPKVFELQVSRHPNVEWTWRFSLLAGGNRAGVTLTIPQESKDHELDGWEGMEKIFYTDIPSDADAARTELSTWFKTIHIQFRKENAKKFEHIPDDEELC